ncbi:MAG: pyridoxamine 5'-phosphate oxidase family protein [Aquihabitans sp.]
MSIDPAAPSDEVLTFLADRHLASLTTARPDGSPHVVAVGFSYSSADQVARIITWAASKKARNVAASPGSRAVVCQIDGRRWLSLEGTATVTDDPARVAAAVDGYAARYRQPSERDDRVAIEIHVDRILGRV